MKFIKLIGLFSLVFGFSSCNTVIGVGRDIKQATQAVGSGVEKGGQAVGSGLENKGYGKTWTGAQSKTTTSPTN